MWAIDSHLDQAIALGKFWGFEYKTIGFIWEKTLKDDPETLRMGLGKWTRKEAEVCLLFTRGKPKRLSGGVRQVIRAPRREHSRKPDEQYDRIEQLVSGPYLEIFSRTDRPGWASWGNQTGKFNIGQTPTRRNLDDLI
jgi:N6-adenosine-specific RNA methylase IME4